MATSTSPATIHQAESKPAPSAVIKLGGSLLDLPDLVPRLEQLRPIWGPRPLMVVGGGPAADLVREWDLRHQLGEERAHWLALDSLALTARLLATLWPAARVASREGIAECWTQGCVPVAIPREWFEMTFERDSPPHTWDTTTDTIAAWIARSSSAQSLWMLKSVTCPASLATATEQELVDPQFVRWVTDGLPIYWVHLRDTCLPLKVIVLSPSMKS